MGSWQLTLNQDIWPIHSRGFRGNPGFTYQFPNWLTNFYGQQTYYLDEVAVMTTRLTTGAWVKEKVTQLVVSLTCVIDGVFIPGVQIGVIPQALPVGESIMEPTGLARYGGGTAALRYCIFPLPGLGTRTFTKTLTGRDLATDMFLLNGKITSLADPQVYANAMRLGIDVWGLTQPNALTENHPVSMRVQLTAIALDLTTTPVYVDPDVGSGSGADTTSWSSGWAKAP